jgi:hypothetical protein
LWGACRTLIGALEHGDISGRLWIAHRGRVRQYEPDDIDDTD